MMDKCVTEPKYIVPVIRIPVLVQGLKDSDLHHTLIEVGRLVFDDFHSHNLMGRHVLALDDLAKGALTQHIENEVAMSLFTSEVVIDVQDIVTVLIIVATIVHRLTGLGQDTSWIKCQFVDKRRVDEMVSMVQI